MNKSHLKLIMELIFIFILPLGIILASISCEKVMTYDENGNQLTEEKHIEYNNVILNEGSGNWINKMTVEQIVDNEDLSTWYTAKSSTVTFNSSNYILITLTNQSKAEVRTNYTPTYANHYYYFKLKYNTNETTPNIRIRIYYGISTYYDEFQAQSNVNNPTTIEYISQATENVNQSYYQFYTLDYSVYRYLTILEIQMVDLTEMFGSGYEPTTIQDYNTYVNNQLFNYSQNGETIEYIGSSIISENATQDLSIWGKLKNLIIDNLQLTDNIIVDIILSYTIIWFIMFIIWHFFYLFFDGLVHIFIDWGHKEKEKVK